MSYEIIRATSPNLLQAFKNQDQTLFTNLFIFSTLDRGMDPETRSLNVGEMNEWMDEPDFLIFT